MTWEVIQGDCLEVMRGLPPASVDACIADPPYGTTACAWDSVIPFAPMWAELKRIVKPKGAIVLFGSQPFTSALVMSNPQMFRYEWVWEKSKATGHAAANVRPLKSHETISVFSREAAIYDPQKSEGEPYTSPYSRVGNSYALQQADAFNTGSIRYDNLNGSRYPRTILRYPDAYYTDGHYHETQKPVDLLRYLVRTYTSAGDTVLDFTCGSGTTGVACEIEGRNSINIDSAVHYCEVARARMKRASGIAADIPRRVKEYAPTPLFEAVA